MKRKLALAIVASIALVVAAVAGVGWYVIGEQRRFARVVADVVASRVGVPVSIERASTNGSRLLLHGVHLPAGPRFPLDVRVREVEIGGGLMTLVAPAGRRVSIVAVAASVAVPPGSGAPPDGATLDALRQRVVALLRWPATMTLRIADGEIEESGAAYRFELTGEKTASETMQATFALDPLGARASSPDGKGLRLQVQARPGAGDSLDLAVDLAAAPPVLTALWPRALPAPSALASRAEVSVLPGGDVALTGRATAGPASAPVVVDASAHYAANPRRLSVSRYALAWEPGVRAEGDGTLALVQEGVRVEATARGTVEGSRVQGRGSYEPGGRFAADVTAAPVDARALGARFGVTVPTQAVARTAHARVTGVIDARGATGQVNVDAGGLRVPTLASLPALDATLSTDAALARTARGGAQLARLAHTTLTLSQQGVEVAVVRGGSSGRDLWPLALDARIRDLARVVALVPIATSLSGSAEVKGTLTMASAATFVGTIDAAMPRAELRAGSPLVLTGVKTTLPVRWAGGGAARATAASPTTAPPPAPGPGTLTADALSAFGLVAERLTAAASFVDGRLLLADAAYAQYGGHGGGWLEAYADGREVPMRARMEAHGLGLAALVKSTGTDIAHASGVIGYVASTEYTRKDGLLATAQITSEGEGGQMSIEALQRIIESPMVEVESSGLLKRTLQNLRVFDYASLRADVTWSGSAGHMDLALKGKKRFGIFPARVEAINIRNMPLSMLARTFTKGNAQ